MKLILLLNKISLCIYERTDRIILSVLSFGTDDRI